MQATNSDTVVASLKLSATMYLFILLFLRLANCATSCKMMVNFQFVVLWCENKKFRIARDYYIIAMLIPGRF